MKTRKKHRPHPWLETRADELGLNLTEAAARCGLVYNYFFKTIKGLRPTPELELLQIAHGLNMSVHEVITGEKDPRSEALRQIEIAVKKTHAREFTSALSDAEDHDRANQPV